MSREVTNNGDRCEHLETVGRDAWCGKYPRVSPCLHDPKCDLDADLCCYCRCYEKEV